MLLNTNICRHTNTGVTHYHVKPSKANKKNYFIQQSSEPLVLLSLYFTFMKWIYVYI